MEYLAIIVLVLSVLAFSFGAWSSNSKAAEPGPIRPATQSVQNQPSNPTPVTPLSKEEIQKKLEALSKSTPPKQFNMGAMCYDMAAPPETFNYICLKCGEKTIYQRNPTDGKKGIETARVQIPEARRLADQIKGVTVELDEHEFCTKCSPENKDPRLNLFISLPGEKKPRLVKNISANDLAILKEFLEGSAIHKGERDQETPLKDFIKRLEELLGVKLDKK